MRVCFQCITINKINSRLYNNFNKEISGLQIRMGGGRCIFRNCSVSAVRNPGMHFFRFPSSDPQRFEKWIAMAGAESIRHMSLEKLRGKLVCGRHFRDEYFMNYKKDRLIRGKAIPTLMRVSNTKAYDYEQIDVNGKPKLITLDTPVSPHLIAPAGFKCPLGFDDDASFNQNDIEFESENDEIHESFKPLASKEIEYNCEIQISSPKKPRILNSYYTKQNELRWQCELSTAKIDETERFLMKEIECMNSDRSTIDVSDDSNTTFVEIVAPKDTFQKENKHEQIVKSLEQQIEQERLKYTKIIDGLRKDNTTLKSSLVKTKIQLASITAENKLVNKKFEELSREHNDLRIDIKTKTNDWEDLENNLNAVKIEYTKLQEEYNKLQSKYNELNAVQQQNNTVSTSCSLISKSTTSTISAPLSKVQLFHGIRKYLSATMTALLRMQMFGSAERDWKPDERQAAVEIFSLGERVYHYFIDEWRFYLPSINDAKSWVNHNPDLGSEEDV